MVDCIFVWISRSLFGGEGELHEGLGVLCGFRRVHVVSLRFGAFVFLRGGAPEVNSNLVVVVHSTFG